MKASAKMLPFVLTILWGGACVCSLFVWIRWLILLFGYTPSLTINISVALVTGFAAAVSISSHAAERSGKSRVRILALFGLATGAYGLTTIWIFHRMEMWYWAAAPALARHAGGLLAAQV